jgi:hypothetical protein
MPRRSVAHFLVMPLIWSVKSSWKEEYTAYPNVLRCDVGDRILLSYAIDQQRGTGYRFVSNIFVVNLSICQSFT